jgi:hypothetical protein
MMPAVESAEAGKEKLAKTLMGRARSNAVLFSSVFMVLQSVVKLIRLKSFTSNCFDINAELTSDVTLPKLKFPLGLVER